MNVRRSSAFPPHGSVCIAGIRYVTFLWLATSAILRGAGGLPGVRNRCADSVVLLVESSEEHTPFREALRIVLHEQPVPGPCGVVADVNPEILQSGQRPVKDTQYRLSVHHGISIDFKVRDERQRETERDIRTWMGASSSPSDGPRSIKVMSMQTSATCGKSRESFGASLMN